MAFWGVTCIFSGHAAGLDFGLGMALTPIGSGQSIVITTGQGQVPFREGLHCFVWQREPEMGAKNRDFQFDG